MELVEGADELDARDRRAVLGGLAELGVQLAVARVRRASTRGPARGTSPRRRATDGPGRPRRRPATSTTSTPSASSDDERALADAPHLGVDRRVAERRRPADPRRELRVDDRVEPRRLGARQRARGRPARAPRRRRARAPRRRCAVPSVPSTRAGASPAATGPPDGTRPKEGLSPDSPHSAEGIRIEPPPSEPVASGTMPGGDRGGRAARGPARGVLEVPGVAREAEDRVGRARRPAVLGGVGLADDDAAGAAQPLRRGASRASRAPRRPRAASRGSSGSPRRPRGPSPRSARRRAGRGRRPRRASASTAAACSRLRSRVERDERVHLRRCAPRSPRGRASAISVAVTSPVAHAAGDLGDRRGRRSPRATLSARGARPRTASRELDAERDDRRSQGS